MRDTFSKIHDNFSIDSSDKDNDDENAIDHLKNPTSPIDDNERKRRRSLGLKMLMSRDSSYGGDFKSRELLANMKSLGDDSIVNQQLSEANKHKRKIEDGSDDEYQNLKFKVKKRKSPGEEKSTLPPQHPKSTKNENAKTLRLDR